MERIHAWYEHELIDRAPIRFTAHNAEFNESKAYMGRTWSSLKERWWDVDYQLDVFENQLKYSVFKAETIPFYWPNLGPEIYAAFYGAELIFQEVTSYSLPLVHDWQQMEELRLDFKNSYFLKLEELTKCALARCKGKYLVGHTSFTPGIDTAASFRDPQQLCLDMLCEPEKVTELIKIASRDYQLVYDHFYNMLRNSGQPSVSWMGIPSYGKMHIPQSDFAYLISPELFEYFVLPSLYEELKNFTHVIFHLDGKGVANHIDYLLDIPQINAIQWVQGMGEDEPIMQWVPLIKKIQAAGKSVVVDIKLKELEPFMHEINPKGIFLCIDAPPETQDDVIKKVHQWR